MGTILALGPFRLDAHNNVLWRGTEPVALGRRAVALLRALVERPGALVLKDALIEAAWPGQAVEDSNLTVQIAALRRALGEAPGGARWIETLPRRGYRFVGPVVANEENGYIATPPRIDAMPEPAPTQLGEAERRQITAVSCELVGATAAIDDMGLEDLGEAIGAFRRRVSEIAGRHDGFIARRLGKNLLVLFGYPTAHEHDAEKAVRAGLELCAAAGTLRPGAEVPMRCRVGIATGMVIAGDFAGVGEPCDHEIVGDAPNLAARLQALAEPDAVVIAADTRRLVGDLFEFRDLTIDTNTGAEPMRSWQVLRESSVASRFEALRGAALTRLVGRDEEIDLLLRRWARAKAGDGQVVLVSGEPGLGKSRLPAPRRPRRMSPSSLISCHCRLRSDTRCRTSARSGRRKGRWRR